MILTLNIGNMDMTVGFYRSAEDKQVARLTVHKGMTEDDIAIRLREAMGLYGVEERPQGAIMASVAPTLTAAAARAVETVTGVAPLLVGPGLRTGLDIKINDPSQLGADLVCMACGAADKYPLPALLISVDDCVTLGYIDGQRRYLGTVICAGPQLLMRSLAAHADLLSPVRLAPPARTLGTDTDESIRAGIIYGLAGTLDGLAARIRAEREVACVAATGAYCEDILPHCGFEYRYDRHLLTDGMYGIWQRQKKDKRL